MTHKIMVLKKLTFYLLCVIAAQLFIMPSAFAAKDSGVHSADISGITTGVELTAKDSDEASKILRTAAYSIFTPLEGDLSIFLLSRLFGSAGNVLQGTGSELSATLFGFFNLGIWVIIGGIISYSIAMSALRTSQEGRVIGERFNIMAVIRGMFGVGLLIPKFTGYSLIQVLVLWAVVQGVNLANGVWGSVLNYAALSGGAAGNSGVLLQGQSQQGDLKKTVVSIAQLLRSQVCLNMMRAYDAVPANVATYVPYYDTQTKQLVLGGKRDMGYWGMCGIYSWAGGGEEMEAYKLAALRQADTALRPIAKRIADRAMALAQGTGSKIEIADNVRTASVGPLSCSTPNTIGCISCLQYTAEDIVQGSACPESMALVSAASTYLELMRALRVKAAQKNVVEQAGANAGWITLARHKGWLLASSFHYLLAQKSKPVHLEPITSDYLFKSQEPPYKSPSVILSRGTPELNPIEFTNRQSYFLANGLTRLLYALRTVCDPDTTSNTPEAGSCNRDIDSSTEADKMLDGLQASYSAQANTIINRLYGEVLPQFDWSASGQSQENAFTLANNNTPQESFMATVHKRLKEKIDASTGLFTGEIGEFLFDIWNAWVNFTAGGKGVEHHDLSFDLIGYVTRPVTGLFSTATSFATNPVSGLFGGGGGKSNQSNNSVPQTSAPAYKVQGPELQDPLTLIRQFGFDLIAASTKFVQKMTKKIFDTLLWGAVAASVGATLIAALGGGIEAIGDWMVKKGGIFLLVIGWIFRAVGFAIKSTEGLPMLIYQIVMLRIFLYLPLVAALVTPIVLIGFIAAIYVPLLPYFIFTFTSIGWFLLVIESVTAAPLIALGVAHPQGHDYLGRAEVGLILVLSVFTRPAMMIIGLVTGMLLLIIFMPFFNATFYVIFRAMVEFFLSSDFSSSAMWVGSAGIMLLYISVITALVKFSYSIIYSLPDRILRWLGGQAEESTVPAMLNELLGSFTQMIGRVASGASSMVSGMRGAQFSAEGLPAMLASLKGLWTGIKTGKDIDEQ